MKELFSVLGRLLAAALTVGALAAAPAAEERVEIQWAELPHVLHGRNVTTVLVDGSELRGRVLGGGEDAIRFEVKESSNRKLYPKGERALTRAQLTVLRYKETRGRWRAMGTAIGVAAGAAVGAVGAVRFNNEGNSEAAGVLVAATTGAGAAAGYLAGREADGRSVLVVVAKD